MHGFREVMLEMVHMVSDAGRGQEGREWADYLQGQHDSQYSCHGQRGL